MNNVKMILEKYGKDTIWFYLKDDKTEDEYSKVAEPSNPTK